MIQKTSGADAGDVDTRKGEPQSQNIRHRRTKQAGARASWPEIRPNLRRAEVATLRRHRAAAGQSTASIDAAVASGRAYSLPDRALGDAVRFSFDEYRAIGEETHRHLATIRPCDATEREIAEHLKDVHRPARAKRAQQRRTKDRAEREARRNLAGDLDCRGSAVLAVTTDRGRTVAELMADLRRCAAFRAADGKQLTGNSLRQAILRELKKPALAAQVETRVTIERHGRPALLVRRRAR